MKFVGVGIFITTVFAIFVGMIVHIFQLIKFALHYASNETTVFPEWVTPHNFWAWILGLLVMMALAVMIRALITLIEMPFLLSMGGSGATIGALARTRNRTQGGVWGFGIGVIIFACIIFVAHCALSVFATQWLFDFASGFPDHYGYLQHDNWIAKILSFMFFMSVLAGHDHNQHHQRLIETD